MLPFSAAAADEMPIRDPWLNDRLPADALVYLRFPHPFGLLAMPKGSVLDPALRSEVNLENVRRIREGIANNVLMHVPAFADLRLRMLEQHLRSPVEVAAFFVPAPAVLIAVNLGLESHADFEDVIDAVSLENPAFGLAEPLGDDGIGQLAGTPVPAFLRFDASSGQLLINAGPGVTAESFAATVAALAAPRQHRMAAMERRIDESGQGFYLWIDAAQAIPAMRMFMQPEQMESMEQLGLDKVSAAALGWGVANGKGRLALVADMPTDGERGLLPYVRNELTARSVGSPDGLLLLSIPGPAEFARLESVALAATDDAGRSEWAELKENFADLAGMSLEEAMAAVGPDVAVIFDEAGDYLALRLREPRTWDRMVANLAEAAGSEPESRRIRGNTYYHASTPGDFALMDEDAAAELGWFAVLARRQRDHFYWTRDDEFLYLASTPQVLIDRDAMRARTELGRWLAEEQRIDARHALLSMSGTTAKLPKRAYGLYIELLQLLADVADTDIDVWSMPTPRQLRLPETGTIGFTVSLGDPTLAAELVFENNPAEFLGGLGGVAAIGVLAAIAIPAYQDYTVRAQVAEGLILAGPVKAAVADYFASNGRFPPAAEAAAMSVFDATGDHVQSITVEADTGRIVVTYTDAVAGGGAELVLEPFVQVDGRIDWGCSGSLDDKLLPAACRSGEFGYDDDA